MKKFKETNELLYERSSEQKLALDVALLDEKNGDMCSIPIDKLKSKVMRDRHKKLCKGDNIGEVIIKGKRNIISL